MFIDKDWRTEFEQHLATIAMTMNVIETTGNNGHVGITALGDRKRDARRAGFEFRQLRLGMADTFGKNSHAIAGLDDFIQLIKSLAVIGRISVLLTRINRDGA